MRKKYSLNLDFARDIRAQRNIVIKEQDSITFEFNIFDDGVPVVIDGHEVRLFIRKADGTMLYQLDNYTVNAHTVVFHVNRQSTTCPGLCYGELEFIKEEDKEYVTTKSFIYKVENKVVDIKGALESIDDVYFLREVEEFIAQAKIDIAEYKETVSNIEAQVEEANERLEQLDTDLKEADFTLKESKENALNEIAQTKNESLDELNQTKDNYIEEITTLKNDSVDEITNIAIESIDNINSKSLEEISKIEDLSEESINKIATLRDNSLSEIDRFKEDSLDEMDALRDEIIENIDDYTVEHIEEIQNTVDGLLPIVEEGRELKTSLTKLNSSASSLNESLYTLYNEAFILNNKLDSKVEDATKKHNELLTVINQGTSIKVDLNAILSNLEAENERAEENINTLNELHPEADIRIETLRALIEEAKKYEEVVRRWIDENGDGNIATEEVLLALETLKASIEEINTNFENYYTKEEADNLLSSYATKEELEAKFETIGTVGISNLPACFTFAPPETEDIKQAIWAKDRSGNCIIIHITETSSSTYNMYLGSSISNLTYYAKAFTRYTWNGAEWVGNSATSNMTIDMPYNKTNEKDTIELIKKNHLFYCTQPIKKDGYSSYHIKEPIEKPQADVLGDYNEVSVKGLYKISHSEEIPNAPKPIIEDGLLEVKTFENKLDGTLIVYQTAKTIEGDVFTRAKSGNNVWTEWKSGSGDDIDLSNLATKEDIKLLSTYGNIQDASNTTNGIISNFNEALEYKEYKVISNGGNILNTPIQEPFNGVLRVSNLDNHIILQELTSDKGEVYTRIFNTNAWTKWSSSGSNIDLSNYTTTSDVENIINTMIEAPKLNIINNINDIIGGM